MEERQVQRQDDGILMPSLRVGAGTGAAGLLFGGVVGTIRSAHPILWAAVTSVQWSMLGGSYWGIRTAILKSRVEDEITPNTKAYTSAISGGLSAAIVGAVTRGRANIIPGSIMGSIVGFVGQKGFSFLDSRHTEALKAPEPKTSTQETFLRRIMQSKYSPMKKLSDDEYKKILQDRLLRIDTEIAVIDDNIAALTKEDETSNSNQPK